MFFDTTNFYSLTSNLPSIAGGNMTICCWVRQSNVIGSKSVMDLADGGAGSDKRLLISHDVSGTWDAWNVSLADYLHTVSPIGIFGQWRFMAAVCDNNTTSRGYTRIEGGGYLQTASNPISQAWGTITVVGIGRRGTGGDLLNDCDIAFPRIWSAALSPTELWTESNSATPVRGTNLELAQRLLVDFSDAIHPPGDFTFNGTFLASAAPAEPTFNADTFITNWRAA